MTMAIIALPSMVLAQTAAGAECRASSGPNTVALLELYTSEGCDSCPPADRWLNELSRRGNGEVQAVGLALHVDYWDHLGWKDPYARAAFAARQREQVKLGGGTVSYTPQVMLNGRDYRRWSHAGTLAGDLRAVNASAARARIALALKQGGQSTAEVQASATVHDAALSPHAALYVALYEDGLSTNVTAGENRGVTLRHDRVVREWFGPLALQGGQIELRRALMLPVRAKVSGAVAFVQHRRTGEVLQALGVSALC